MRTEAEKRRKILTMGDSVDAALKALLTERSTFFDEVCARWNELFPDLPVRPGEWRDGRLVLFVDTAGILFAMRPRLAEIKRELAKIDGAPKRLPVILQIRSRQQAGC